jgi:hypothetical protein
MPTIEERAVLLLNEAAESLGSTSRWCSRTGSPSVEALCRALEAHDATLAEFEAFKREVSDAVNGFERYCTVTDTPFPADLFRFIIPKPVDPLVDAIREASVSDADSRDAERLRAALAKRGLKLVEVGDA